MVQLDKKDYAKLVDRVKQIPFNNLFARAVTEQKITGKIFVDDPSGIKTVYVVHPYGMTLLLGDSTNQDFNKKFKNYALNSEGKRNSFEWMQTYPRVWDEKMKEIFGANLMPSEQNISLAEKGIVELNTRVNFQFDKDLYLQNKVEVNDPDIRIVPTDETMYREMKGTVVPKYFWDNEKDFFIEGMAYSLLYKGELTSMAFSSCKFENQLELGIETNPQLRGKGLAEMVCTALIDYCIEKKLEPIWACRKENIGSYKLAQKLGFRPSLELPYYRLSN